MGSRAMLMLMLFLMLSSPLANAQSAFQGQAYSEGDEVDQISPLSDIMTETERLELAASHWRSMPSAQGVTTSLQPSTGLIHLAAGSFDPLVPSSMTLLSSNDIHDVSATGMAIVQLHEPNGEVLEGLVTGHGLKVLDVLHDEAWLVRLPSPPLSSMASLQNEPDVRWVGPMHSSWRLAPEVDASPSMYSALTLLPTPDLALGGLDVLSTDLVRYGASEASCDGWICKAVVDPLTARSLVDNIARDGRIMWTEPSVDLRVHNALAWSVAGVQNVANNATFTLDGSGEMIAIADTGLDQNHPDLTGRVAATYTQFGLDPSPADTNGGHGTHIAITVLGDGTGDAAARGVAPAANLVMYALEHDPTGVFGRIGSIYDMLRDAEQMTARISVNAWGLNGNYGQYTADARSVDTFVHDRKDLTPVFSVGDRGTFGASQVASPATGKNVIGVGASTTGAAGTPAAGEVANFSSRGPSLDGRIKPDVVAPGVGLCSGLAEEAKYPAGPSCLTGSHAGGNAYYMSLTGTSQATAVASGVTALTREFIREQVGLTSPSSALVKAAVINGAKDLGQADIPNAEEGWGQVDLERTVLPVNGATVLDTYMDDNKVLAPGFGLLYSFSMDPSNGIDLTLVWTDEAGSANAPQNEPRLVNDLDLTLTSPTGEVWMGNNFAQGFSVTGGSADTLNNVERIRIAPGTLSGGFGTWIVQVNHRGGTNQDFALVMSATATPTPQADLTVFDGSILTSSENPLKNDLISIRLAWVNQGTTATPEFKIRLEDTTTQTVLANATRPALAPGMIDSTTIFHSFTTTGIHTLRLSVDTGDTVTEMNDANVGIDNNIWVQDVEVMALGVRVVVNNADGSLPSTATERAENALMALDVRNDSGINVPLTILHEGTGNQSVKVSVSMVQIPVPGRDNFFLPSEDLWTRTLNESGPYLLSAQGTTGANKGLDLRLEDIDSDFTTDPSNPRYVRAGTYVVEITARYEYQPTVAHTQRIMIEVEQIDQVSVVAAGTTGLEAQPGGSSIFSISVKNTGNAPARYSMECFSEHRWQVMLGSSNSSQLDFEPLNLLEYLPMSIRVIVPLVASGTPAAGDTDTVTCYVTSFTDETMNFTQTATVTVLPQESFTVDVMDDDGPLGPTQTARDISVDSGELVHLNMSIQNTGNIAVDLVVSVLPDNPQWALQVSHDGVDDTRRVSLTLLPGQTTLVGMIFGVPATAEEGDSNSFTIRTERSLSNFRQNVTTLVVRDELGVTLTPPEDSHVDVTIAGRFSYASFTVKNTGNTNLGLTWTHGLAPDGWQVGFANPTVYLEPREEKVVRFGLIPPAKTPAGAEVFELLISVNATNAGRYVEASNMLSVGVLPSSFANITAEDDRPGLLQGISREDGRTVNFIVRNDGNIPFSGEFSGLVVSDDGQVRSDWSASLSPSTVENLPVGEELVVKLTLKPSDDVARGRAMLLLNVSSGADALASLSADVSIETATGSSGLLNSLPLYVTAPLGLIVLIGLVVAGRRMKSSGTVVDDGLDLVAPDTHASPDVLGSRRDEALDLGSAVNELTSGEVSDDEIAQAIMQSMDLPMTPAAVPAGLPPGGLPPAGLPSRATAPPAGLPPLGMPPVGLPPVGLPLAQTKALPPLPTSAPPQINPVDPTPSGPPLPPTGLPPGWSMEQWQHYGEEWLKRNG